MNGPTALRAHLRLLLTTSLTCVAAACASARDAEPPSPPPRFVDVWLGGPLDSIYNAEYQRLSSACSGQGDACWVEALDTTAVRLTPVWETADGDDQAGWLVARLRTEGRWPRAALLFQGSDGDEVTLRDDLGDWGYGTTLALRDAREGRLRPWLLEPAGPYWIGESEPSAGFGVVEGPYGLEGRLWSLEPITAEPILDAGAGAGGAAAPGADAGGSVELPAGVYMILEVDDRGVRLRPEVPGDMACGEPVDPSASGPAPVYEAPLARLLDAEGRPRVEVAYGKGC